MNHAAHYQIAKNRSAELIAQAQRDALARAARRHHREQPHQSGHPAPKRAGIARRVLAFFGIPRRVLGTLGAASGDRNPVLP